MPRCSNIPIDPEILGGIPRFNGIHVHVKILLAYLAYGDSLDQFLAQYPSVQRDHTIRLLKVSHAAQLAA